MTKDLAKGFNNSTGTWRDATPVKFMTKVDAFDHFDKICNGWEEAEHWRNVYEDDKKIQFFCRLQNTKVVVVNSDGAYVPALPARSVIEIRTLLSARDFNVDRYASNSFTFCVYRSSYYDHLKIQEHSIATVPLTSYILTLNHTRERLKDGRLIDVATDNYGRCIIAEHAVTKKYVFAGNHQEFRQYCHETQSRDGTDCEYIYDIHRLYGTRRNRKDFVFYGTYAERKDCQAILEYVHRYWESAP